MKQTFVTMRQTFITIRQMFVTVRQTFIATNQTGTSEKKLFGANSYTMEYDLYVEKKKPKKYVGMEFTCGAG